MFVYVVTVRSEVGTNKWFVVGVYQAIETAEKMAESWRGSHPVVSVTKVLLDE